MDLDSMAVKMARSTASTTKGIPTKTVDALPNAVSTLTNDRCLPQMVDVDALYQKYVQ